MMEPDSPSAAALADFSTVEQVMQMAQETFGSDEKARRWLHRPTTALSGSSPLDVSLSGADGAKKVVDLLRRIDHGLAL